MRIKGEYSAVIDMDFDFDDGEIEGFCGFETFKDNICSKMTKLIKAEIEDIVYGDDDNLRNASTFTYTETCADVYIDDKEDQNDVGDS